MVLVFTKEEVYVRRDDTPEEGEAFIHRASSKAESRHGTCIPSFLTGGSARHRYIAEIFFGGLAHVVKGSEF